MSMPTAETVDPPTLHTGKVPGVISLNVLAGNLTMHGFPDWRKRFDSWPEVPKLRLACARLFQGQPFTTATIELLIAWFQELGLSAEESRHLPLSEAVRRLGSSPTDSVACHVTAVPSDLAKVLSERDEDRENQRKEREAANARKAWQRALSDSCGIVRGHLMAVIKMTGVEPKKLRGLLSEFGARWREYEELGRRSFARVYPQRPMYETTSERVERLAKDSRFPKDVRVLLLLLIYAFKDSQELETICASLLTEPMNDLNDAFRWLPFFRDELFTPEPDAKGIIHVESMPLGLTVVEMDAVHEALGYSPPGIASAPTARRACDLVERTEEEKQSDEEWPDWKEMTELPRPKPFDFGSIEIPVVPPALEHLASLIAENLRGSPVSNNEATPLPPTTQRAKGENGTDSKPGTTPKTKNKGGRPSDTDKSQRKRIVDSWNTGQYVKYEDLARELNVKVMEVKRAIDAERKSP